MARRDLLHLSKIPAFSDFIETEGFEILPTKGEYEVLRAKGPKGIMVLYTKLNAKEHCSVMDKDIWIVKKFLKQVQKEKENGNKT